MARDQRQKATGVPHIHFDGAGGNIGAGKWNDGSPENRQVLADRVAAGMAKAWEATVKTPITAADLGWASIPVALPVAPHLDEERLQALVKDASKPARERAEAARELVWLRRCRAGDTIDVACLRLGKARVLHLPGELFVEYQLAAQKLRPDLFVAMAAYGDYAPGYIGTEVAYPQGGYETGPKASLVAPKVEGVLMDVIKKLLRVGETHRRGPRIGGRCPADLDLMDTGDPSRAMSCHVNRTSGWAFQRRRNRDFDVLCRRPSPQPSPFASSPCSRPSTVLWSCNRRVDRRQRRPARALVELLRRDPTAFQRKFDPDELANQPLIGQGAGKYAFGGFRISLPDATYKITVTYGCVFQYEGVFRLQGGRLVASQPHWTARD